MDQFTAHGCSHMSNLTAGCVSECIIELGLKQTSWKHIAYEHIIAYYMYMPVHTVINAMHLVVAASGLTPCFATLYSYQASY